MKLRQPPDGQFAVVLDQRLDDIELRRRQVMRRQQFREALFAIQHKLERQRPELQQISLELLFVVLIHAL